MKAISIVQPYTFVICVSGRYDMPRTEDTEYRGKLLVCAGEGCEVPSLEGLVEEQAMCVVELADVQPLTAEQKEALGDSDAAYVWTLENPRLVAPFAVSQQEGMFDVVHDIEYLASEAQFKKEYEDIIPADASMDVMNAYAYITSSHFEEDRASNSAEAANGMHF